MTIHELMLILDELVVSERDAGDLDAALAHALELKRQMWSLHGNKTRNWSSRFGHVRS